MTWGGFLHVPCTWGSQCFLGLWVCCFHQTGTFGHFLATTSSNIFPAGPCRGSERTYVTSLAAVPQLNDAPWFCKNSLSSRCCVWAAVIANFLLRCLVGCRSRPACFPGHAGAALCRTFSGPLDAFCVSVELFMRSRLLATISMSLSANSNTMRRHSGFRWSFSPCCGSALPLLHMPGRFCLGAAGQGNVAHR